MLWAKFIESILSSDPFNALLSYTKSFLYPHFTDEELWQLEANRLACMKKASLLRATIVGLEEFIVMIIFYQQALGLCCQALWETALQNLLAHNQIIFYSLQHLQKSYIRNHRKKVLLREGWPHSRENSWNLYYRNSVVYDPVPNFLSLESSNLGLKPAYNTHTTVDLFFPSSAPVFSG